MLSMALWLLSVLVPLQILLGDLHGLNTLEYQPAKLAAIEAHWDTGARVPLVALRASRREGRDQPRRDRHPDLGSLILTHDLERRRSTGSRIGQPTSGRRSRSSFFAFRIMVGIGMLMLADCRGGWWLLRWRGGCSTQRWFLRLCQIAVAARLYRGARRLDDDRGRTAALDGLRPDAHRRFGLALADRARRADVAGRLRRRLSAHLPVRHRLSWRGLVKARAAGADAGAAPIEAGRPAAAGRRPSVAPEPRT